MKDKDNKDELIVDNKKKFNKNILLIILLVIVSLIGIFFASTYIRWNAEISELVEVYYYGQEDIKIVSLKDFYGNDLEVDLKDNEALKLYCSSKYGDECLTGNYTDNLENLFRNPYIVINIVILIDIIIIYFIIRNKEIGNIKVYIISSIILLFGLYSFGFQIYRVADYVLNVNDSDNAIEAEIVKGVIPNNGDKFKPIVSYTTENGDYNVYLDYEIDGLIKDKVGDKITIYYSNEDESIIEVKRSFVRFIIPFIVSIGILVMSIFYFKLKRKDKYSL